MSAKLTRKIIHIDMDCFYAAVEMRDNPNLKNIPIAVGGAPNQRGVLCTCNYEARKYGIRSAMATAYALKLCPTLTVLPVHMQKYREESEKIQSIFYEYTNLVEPLSLDEAYLDVTESPACQNSATYIAREIRQRIFEQFKLTASAGIATNKCLAKIASEWKKPNGQFVITPDQVSVFMETLSVRKLFGVGEVMEKKLQALGISTCGDLQKMSSQNLMQHFGQYGERLYQLCRGLDDRPVETERLCKSISVEETYHKDLLSLESCLMQVPQLTARLRKRVDNAGETPKIHKLFIKIKFGDFTKTTVECVSDTIDMRIFNNLMTEGYSRKTNTIRLLGVGVRLQEESPEHKQLKLF